VMYILMNYVAAKEKRPNGIFGYDAFMCFASEP